MKLSWKLIFNSIYVFIIISTTSCQNTSDPVIDTKLIANAGEDQTTITGSYAVFDPTKSSGDFTWYEWKQDENNPDTVKIFSQNKTKLGIGNIHKVVFIKEGVYRFRLIVKRDYKDTNGSEPDTLTITVEPNHNSKFGDPNLEGTVRAELNKQIEELDENTLLGLDTLQSMPTPELISSLKGLEFCSNLIDVHMGSQNIFDISQLASLIKLKILWLDQNYKIRDITPLANLTELEELNLDENLISDISPLEKLTKLKYLSLQYNSINDISIVQNMIELREFWIAKANLNNLSPLSNLTKLELLWVDNCGVEDISALKNLTNIKTLKIAWNKVNDISYLSNMKMLDWLALEKNSITDITSLTDLPNLSYIRLWDNQIKDIKPLVDNLNIGKDDIVGLDGNPLNEKSINEYIPALQARGAIVTW